MRSVQISGAVSSGAHPAGYDIGDGVGMVGGGLVTVAVAGVVRGNVVRAGMVGGWWLMCGRRGRLCGRGDEWGKTWEIFPPVVDMGTEKRTSAGIMAG